MLLFNLFRETFVLLLSCFFFLHIFSFKLFLAYFLNFLQTSEREMGAKDCRMAGKKFAIVRRKATRFMLSRRHTKIKTNFSRGAEENMRKRKRRKKIESRKRNFYRVFMLKFLNWDFPNGNIHRLLSEKIRNLYSHLPGRKMQSMKFGLRMDIYTWPI